MLPRVEITERASFETALSCHRRRYVLFSEGSFHRRYSSKDILFFFGFKTMFTCGFIQIFINGRHTILLAPTSSTTNPGELRPVQGQTSTIPPTLFFILNMELV